MALYLEDGQEEAAANVVVSGGTKIVHAQKTAMALLLGVHLRVIGNVLWNVGQVTNLDTIDL